MSHPTVSETLTPESVSMPEVSGRSQDPPPAPDAGAETFRASGLYGAPLVGAFNPVPVVAIGGVDVASGTIGGVTLPGLMVVDGVSITWGRSDIYDQPDPATGQLVLFDPSGVWAVGADRRGQAVTLSYQGTAAGLPIRKVYFRGRVGSPIRFEPKTVQVAGKKIRGALVYIPLISVLVDYANRAVVADWPEEFVGDRRARLNTLWSGSGITITTRPYWDQPKIAPVATKDQGSLYQAVVDLFDSTGADRLTYLPDSQSLTYIPRRDYPNTRGHGALWWDAVSSGTARAGKGVYVRATGGEPANGTYAVYSYLDAGYLEDSDRGSLTTPEKITRVVVAHPTNSQAGFPQQVITQLVTGTSEGIDAMRELRHESQITYDNFATTAASDLAYMVAREGSAWKLGNLHWSTRRTGGFEDSAQAALLLAGGEVQDLFFLQGSDLPRLFGMTPVYGVMGQTIAYSRGGWDIDLQLSPLALGALHHAISWSEIDDGSAAYEVQWWDDDNPRGMHESLTYEDLGSVHRGLMPSATPTGPDQGWDFKPK